MTPINEHLASKRVINKESKQDMYLAVQENINALIIDEDDAIALMATIVCELHHAIPYFDWTGFYRVVSADLLKIGPYQGSHGCLEIAFNRGVCGAAARTQQTQIVDDVSQHPGHIACSTTTRSEIVVPVFNNNQE